jgi:hypothetical protein
VSKLQGSPPGAPQLWTISAKKVAPEEVLKLGSKSILLLAKKAQLLPDEIFRLPFVWIKLEWGEIFRKLKK